MTALESRKTGLWIIGALGQVAASVFLGAAAIKNGLATPTGMVTSSPPFDGLGLVDGESLVFGGCDVRQGTLMGEAAALCRETPGLQRLDEALSRDLALVQENLTSGTGTNCGEAIERMGKASGIRKKSLREEIEEIRRTLRRFKKKNGLERVIVVNLASTEPALELTNRHDHIEELERALDEDEVAAVRASTLYAYSAIREGCPFINFTPSNGALFPAMLLLARSEGVPVMGNDGKTGETLVKSALAPLFTARNLDVLSWEGFNILGNRDGRILDHPDNRASKVRSKDQILSKVLGYSPHSKVGIDYVPSLGDRKTAWDFIHFRGFLGVDMSLQFVWQGYDSMLAAPLILDLVRLADLAARRGEAGILPHLALFFKSPLGSDEHRLAQQFDLLVAYAGKVRKGMGRNLNIVKKKGVR